MCSAFWEPKVFVLCRWTAFRSRYIRSRFFFSINGSEPSSVPSAKHLDEAAGTHFKTYTDPGIVTNENQFSFLFFDDLALEAIKPAVSMEDGISSGFFTELFK